MFFWDKYPIKKIKVEKEKLKKERSLGQNQCRKDRSWGHMWSSQSMFDLWKKNLRISREECIKPLSNDPLLHQMHYLQIMELTVLKLLRALSKSSTRSSDPLNLEFESVHAAATCSLELLTNLFFIELFSIRILLFCCCFLLIYACANTSIDQAQ